jgi:hypothetical protein
MTPGKIERTPNASTGSLMMAMPFLALATLLCWTLACSSSGPEDVPETVNFNLHVRPILSDRCFKCHGPDGKSREANLRLDTEEGAFQALQDDPAKHVIVKGDPLRSELFQRISSPDTSLLMPPPSSHLSLSAKEIELIRRWIQQGAPYQKHWAFIAPKKPPLPGVKKKNWPRNEIDYFILHAMEAQGLAPNDEADPASLLRRLCVDLTGLPPSPSALDEVLKSKDPGKWEKHTESLLSSAHYGERMAIPWLDLARYADSHGYQDDGMRTMWPWRDWVIHAFNENLSYDQFITWQIAGDQLPNPSREQILATGFNRNHKITQEGGVIDEEYRIEYVTDRTNTFGKAFLALTYECAKCHDHKYDPISQKEYYSSFAFFNQVNEKGLVGDITLASPGDPPVIQISSEEIRNTLRFINKKDSAPVVAMVMKDSSKPRITRLLKRGVYDQPGDTVDMLTPAAVLPFDTTKFIKNRLGLAQWLTDPAHPLTARVFVNRIWQEFFGRGLVKSSGDFGMQGDLPTHPQLLDWLAVDFMEHGWDVKRLVRQITGSATYRQSAVRSPKKQQQDPENIYYSYSQRLRLSAELLRDHVLASSGLLVREIGGPSVKPYQPKGVWESTTSGRGELARYVQDHGDKLYRRGMYTFIKRTAPPPSMLVFDAVGRDQCEVKRLRTNTPIQALVLMNDPMVLEASRVLAETLVSEGGKPETQIEKAFHRILCRKILPRERERILQYYQAEKKRFSQETARANAFVHVGEFPSKTGLDQREVAALMQVIHMMYNLEEASVKP